MFIKGGGNIIRGIGKALGDTITAVAKGGSTIMKSIGQSLIDTLDGVAGIDGKLVGTLTNATTQVITSTTSGIAKILSSFGGLGGFLLWILVILLYLFIFSQYIPSLVSCKFYS